jgi:hypothetical protein
MIYAGGGPAGGPGGFIYMFASIRPVSYGAEMDWLDCSSYSRRQGFSKYIQFNFEFTFKDSIGNQIKLRIKDNCE